MQQKPQFETFLEELQKEAELQAKIGKTRIFPQQLDAATSFIGKYSWQTLVLFSFMTTVFIQIIKRI